MKWSIIKSWSFQLNVTVKALNAEVNSNCTYIFIIFKHRSWPKYTKSVELNECNDRTDEANLRWDLGLTQSWLVLDFSAENKCEIHKLKGNDAMFHMRTTNTVTCPIGSTGTQYAKTVTIHTAYASQLFYRQELKLKLNSTSSNTWSELVLKRCTGAIRRRTYWERLMNMHTTA